MLIHRGTIPLESPRLLLRRFSPEDARSMYENWASDPEVTKYLTWQPHESVDASRSVIENWCEEYEKDNYYHWVIVLKATGEPIGSLIAICKDDRIAMAHIGYCIGKHWWHKGFMSEALQRVMDFLFDEVGMRRIESRHDPHNPHSGAVMRKCGMQYEGTLRQADWNNQGVCDCAYYGLLASERTK